MVLPTEPHETSGGCGVEPSRWRVTSRGILAAILTLAALLAFGDRVDADTEDESVRRRLGSLHGIGGGVLPPLDPKDWTEAQIQRIHRLERFYVCACPKENYSKTLENCPDGCADEQKTLIRVSVREGLTDPQIRRQMVDKYSSRVIGLTQWEGSGKWSYLLPLFAIVITFVVGLLILARWIKSGRKAREVREDRGQFVSDEALDRVRRELDGIE